MRKWAVLILSILAVFAFAVAAQADNTLGYIDRDANPEILLWDSVGFDIHFDTISHGNVQVLYKEGQEVVYEDWIFLDGEGNGNSWFTPGVSGTDLFDLDEVYNAQLTSHTYTVVAQNPDNENEKTIELSFTTKMKTEAPPAFTPSVTNVSSTSISQDGFFRATVTNNKDFDFMCIAVFDSNDEYVTDSHWIEIDPDKKNTTIEVPLLRCKVNQQYTAKLYALKHGYPMVFYNQNWPIRVTSPSAQITNDIQIIRLKSSYETGENILPTIYYPNKENLTDLMMEVRVYSDTDEIVNDGGRWDYNRGIGQDEDGTLYYQPELWDCPQCWWTGEEENGQFVLKVIVWETNDDYNQWSIVEKAERKFKVTSKGSIDYDPGLPVYIEAPADKLTIPRISQADFYTIRIENGDDHDWEADPDWDNTIAEFTQEDPGEGAHVTDISNIKQRVHVWIDAGTTGYDWYHYEKTIPIVKAGSRIQIWTDEETLNAQPLPIHSDARLWIDAKGASWVRLENEDGEFAYWGDSNEIQSRVLENGTGINRTGDNYVVATAGFDYDEKTDTWTEEQAVLILKGAEPLGRAGDFTATLSSTSVKRGDPITVTYTKSEHADHYWVDLDVWNEDWDDWDWRSHLADLNDSAGQTIMNTITLEPGTYRVRALAEGVGYETAEYVITKEFTVTPIDVQNGETKLFVEKTEAKTNEQISVGFLAPGADWVDIYYKQEDGWENWFANSGGESTEGSFSDSNSGTVKVIGRAHYLVLDKNGNEIIETDEQGNRYSKEEWIDSEPVEVTFTATNGKIEQDASQIPVSATAGKDLTLKMSRPAKAEYMGWEVYLNRDNNDDEQQPDYRSYDDADKLELTIPGDKVIQGNTIELRVWVGGVGYEHNHQNYTILVTNGSESRIKLEVGKTALKVNENFAVTVTVTEPGVKTIQYNNGYNFWGHWEDDKWSNDDIELDNEGSWGHYEDYGESGVKVLYARAWIGEEWVNSDPVKVTVTSDGQVGEVGISLEKPTVTRGDIVTLSYTPAENSDEERYDLHHDRNRDNDDEDNWVDYDLRWDKNTKDHTMSFSTAGMPEGEYTLRVWAAGKTGYEGRESKAVTLKVTSNNVPEGKVSLTVSKEEALTNESISAGIIAPGADWVELIRRYDDGRNEDEFANNGGEGVSGNFSEGSEQTVEVIGRAHYFERDKEGNTIPETDKDGKPVIGDNGDPIIKELPYKEASKTVTFTAPNGILEQDASSIPVSARPGEALTLKMPRPKNAEYMGWNVYLDWDNSNYDQEPDLRSDNDNIDGFELTIPADKVVEGNTIQVGVWVGGIGYEHNHQNYRIPVTNGSESRIKLSVSKEKVKVNEQLKVTVTVTETGVETIQYNNGYGFWTHWNENGQEVINDLELDENGQWINNDESFGGAGVNTLYARAKINGEWVNSDPVRVTITADGQVGTFDVSLEEETVTRGETAVLNYTIAENSEENSYDLHHEIKAENVGYDLHWDRNTNNHTIAIATGGMPAGEYALHIWASGKQGYEGRDSKTVILRVNEAAQNTVTLDIPVNTVKTGEELQVNAYASGAKRIEIDWGINNDVWDGDGESMNRRYRYDQSGVYQVTARAYYMKGETETSIESDSITVTVTSSGLFPLNLSGIPTVITANQKNTVTIPYPEGSENFGWELGRYADEDGHDIQISNSGDEPLKEDAKVEIPAFAEGTQLYLAVWAGAAGYDHNYDRVRITVSGKTPEGITFTLEPETLMTCEQGEAFVTFPADTYTHIQLCDDWHGVAELPIEPDMTSVSFGTGDLLNRKYSTYARLWPKDGNDWVYTETKILTVNNPNGSLGKDDFDDSVIPTAIYEGQDATFTLSITGNATDLNYELWDQTAEKQLISWDGEKDGTVVIHAKDIVAGHRYHFSYNVTAMGWAPVSDGKDIMAYAEPTVTLSADKKSVKYDETVTFTVGAPGATKVKVVPLLGEIVGDPLDGLTWKANSVGTTQFFAIAEYPSFGEVKTTKNISITVKTLGAAPKPTVTAPEKAVEGESIEVTVTPAEGGWASVSIFASSDQPEVTEANITSSKTITVPNAKAGEYQVYVDYGKYGYDGGPQIEIDIPVSHVYGGPVWAWAKDYSSATATFTCTGGDDEQKIPATISVTAEEGTCKKVCTATVTFQGTEYTDIKTLTEEVHEWNAVPTFKWSEDAKTAKAVFTCKNNAEHTREEDANVTEFSHKDATCTAPETTTFEATYGRYSDKKSITKGEALGHNWTIVWNDDFTAHVECDRCQQKSDVAVTPTHEETKKATCKAKGEITYTAKVTVDGKELTSAKKEYTDKTDHTPGAEEKVDGMFVTKCTVCEEILSCKTPEEVQLEADMAKFEANKPAQKEAADDLLLAGDGEACKKLIADAKAAIDAMAYDKTKSLEENYSTIDDILAKLVTDLEAQRAADKQAADAVKAKIDALPAADKVTTADKAMIDEAVAAYNALTADQKKLIDDAAQQKLNAASTALATAEKAAADEAAKQEAAAKLAEAKQAFVTTKASKQAAAVAMAQSGDSAASQQLIAAAQAQIEALAYDESKTPEENQAAIDAIITKLNTDLATQRAADAEPVLKPGTYTVSNGVYEVKSDGTAIFLKPEKAAGSVKILDEVPASECGVAAKVTAIKDKAFSAKDVKGKLTKVTVGRNVKTIGKSAFADCAKLKTVSGGANVENIKDSAFSGCKALSKFTFGANLTNLGKKAFYNCAKLKNLTFKGTGKLKVGSGAVQGIAPQAKVKVPKKVEKIYGDALKKKGKLPAGAKVNNK